MNVLFIVKLLVSAALIAIATEVAKRYPSWGAVIIVLPLTSMLAMAWLYFETRDDALVSQFARDVFVLVPVSLVFFIPFLVETRTGFGFVGNMLAGTALLAAAVWLVQRFLP